MGKLEGKVAVITGGNSGIASSDSSFLLRPRSSPTAE
jgi:hypothetical protein